MQIPQHKHSLTHEAKETFAFLKEYNPEAMNGFIQFIHGIEKKGVLSEKFKQLITVALAVNKQCKFCIAYHTRKALEKGASKDELLETCLTASLMGGGPSMMYIRYVIKEIELWEKVA